MTTIMASKVTTQCNAFAIAGALLQLACVRAEASVIDFRPVSCITERDQTPRQVQKGLFTVNVPKSAKEQKLDADDSLVWSWSNGRDVLVVSYGFRQGPRNAMTQEPCSGAAAEGNLRLEVTKRGRRFTHATHFLSPFDPTYAISVRATSNSSRLSPWLVQSLSSFVWVGDLARVRVVSVDPQKQSAVIRNENNVPFAVKRGDVIAHPWAELSEVRPDEIVVVNYRTNKVTGDFETSRSSLPLDRSRN